MNSLGLWPPLNVPLRWRDKTKKLKKYGNSKGASFLKEALQGRKISGDKTPLILPKNIRVVSARNGQLLMPLSES